MGHLIIPQTGVELFRGEVFLSQLGLISTTTTGAITLNVAAQSVAVASSANFAVGATVLVDTGVNLESVVLTAIVDATHISGIFTKNHLSGVVVTNGAYQNVPMGIVQDFGFNDTVDLKELRGPKSRLPIAVAQSGAKVSGDCTFGSTNAQILSVLRGASLSTSVVNGATITKASRKGSDNLKPCVVELFDVDNEGGPHALFYNVIFSDLQSPFKLDDYTMWKAPFVCYPDPVTGNIYDIFYPGDQTAAYVLPVAYPADAGAAIAQTDYLTTAATVGHVE